MSPASRGYLSGRGLVTDIRAMDSGLPFLEHMGLADSTRRFVKSQR